MAKIITYPFILLAIGATGGIFLAKYFYTPRSISNQTQTVATESISAQKPVVDQQCKEDIYSKRVLETIQHGDLTLIAYNLIFDCKTSINLTSGNYVFFVEIDKLKDLDYRVMNNFNTIGVSSFSPSYSFDQLFDVVGENLYVINADTNRIDLYQRKKEENIYTYSYLKSLKLPQYDLGTIYGIGCQKDECEVKTAFHLESGCRLSLNLSKEQFSEPLCGGFGIDEFIPEKL